MASDMNVAALGRPFSLGMLYDAREDNLITGLTLWDAQTLKKNTVPNFQRGSAFKTSASDTIESKSSLLDIEASLKASFLSGLVEVGGSAKYLKDTKKYTNQSRLTFQYKATTNFKQLLINNMSMDARQMAVIEKSSATHIVTGILYGANAFFVFDSEKLDSSSVQDIQVGMEAVIKKIPLFNVEGKVNIQLSDKEEKVTKKFSCKFYGDFILDSNPATFEEAVKTYVELPKLLGENGEKSVPVKVWLTPLRKLNPKAAELKREISFGLMMKVEKALEELREIDMRCNDSLVDSMVKKFPQVHKDVSRFQQLCGAYAAKLKQTMAEKLPSIREGKEDERSTEQIFDDREESPFSHEELTEWLDHKQAEINVIKTCVEVCGEIKFIRNQSALMREAVCVEDALCFVFTSMESADPCLDVMTDYFDSPTVESAHEHPWYYSHQVLTNMKEKAEAFQDLAKALKKRKRFCFFITAIENEKYKGATIYHYKNGGLVTEDFSKPYLPPLRTITDKRDLIWYVTDLTLDPDTANGYLTLSDDNKKATCTSWQYYPDNPERFDKHTQVLCKEGLTGRHYWEVEWNTSSRESIYILAGYKGVARKGGGPDSELGRNPMSWCFGKVSDGSNLKAWHDGCRWKGPIPSLCNRVGVFLDWPAGTLSFYQVLSNRLKHLYTFHTTFREPLYPGLWAHNYDNYAYLCPVE